MSTLTDLTTVLVVLSCIYFNLCNHVTEQYLYIPNFYQHIKSCIDKRTLILNDLKVIPRQTGSNGYGECCFFKYKAAYIHDMRNCAIIMCLDTGITTVFGLIGRDKLSPLLMKLHFK